MKSRRKKKIYWNCHPLGKVPDGELAKKLGISRTAVAYQRRLRKIPPFVEAPTRISIDWLQQPLGKVSDADLADKLGVTRAYIARIRKKFRIPIFSEVDKVVQNAQMIGKNLDDNISFQDTALLDLPRLFEINIRIKNNRLKQRRLELGYATSKDFAKAVGITHSDYVAFENIKVSPLNRFGRWKDSVLKIAKFHGCSPDDLFPLEIRNAKHRVLTFKADARDLAPLLPENIYEPVALPDEIFTQKELEVRIQELLDTFPPRHVEMVKWRFGFIDGSEHTYAEIGKRFGLTVERTRQIVERVIRRCRYPSRLKVVKEFY